MPRSIHRPPPAENDPEMLPESTRDYYRSTWGFDPITGCHILRKGGFRYEECFPLSQDLPLQAVGVMICARVDWKGDDIRNRIVFRRTDAKGRRRKASVECTHTVAYAEPEGDTPLDILESLAKEMMDEISENPRRPVILPPWEHFAALKSYVAGIAAKVWSASSNCNCAFNRDGDLNCGDLEDFNH